MLDRFNELFGGQQAMDRVRNQRMPTVGPTLDYIGMLFRHVRGFGRLTCCYRGGVHVRKLDCEFLGYFAFLCLLNVRR